MLGRALFVAAAVALPQLAIAGVPAWCGDHQGNPAGANQARSPEVKDAISGIVDALCSPPQSGVGFEQKDRDEVEKLRATWSQRLLMTDADWGDAVAWRENRADAAKLSVKSLAAMTPVDQFAALSQPLPKSDAMYLADALDARLTETGRLAFLLGCVKDTTSVRDDEDMGKWAVCQDDMDRFDFKKLTQELHGDTAHPAAARFALRVHGYEVGKRIAEIRAAEAKFIAADDEFKKVFDVANAGRGEWVKTVGTNQELLDLVLATDSGVLLDSRKQLAGCEAKTDAALAAAVGTLPAKTFVGMHDVRDDPNAGFVHALGPVLASTPVTNLAMIAYLECQPTRAIATHFGYFIGNVPGYRGPRSAAAMALLAAQFKFDDPKTKLRVPWSGPRPYDAFTDRYQSAGGVVHTVHKGADTITVALEKTKIMQEECVASHDSGRISEIRNGKVYYQRICDKTSMVTHDTTWNDFVLRATYASVLKPGVVFSAADDDLIALWPRKEAKMPSWVLGAQIK